MKISRGAILLTIATAAATLLLWACATKPPVIPDNLSVNEIFQRAQDAEDKNDYSLAITYYSLTSKSYPDDTSHIVWASYEIAFLYHKMGKNDTALTLINNLLDRYAKEADTLPPAPRVLAEKLKTRLEALAPKKQ
jgi:outer membrane protein assembly factor BamD (BamD/ComL family)